MEGFSPEVEVGAEKRPADSRKRAVTSRQLHRGHFAFFRAIVQGLCARSMWERYLQEEGRIETDIYKSATAAGTGRTKDTCIAGDQPHAFALHPVVQRTTAWLRHEICRAARQSQRSGMIRLLRSDFSAIAPRGDGLLPLEEFVAQQGLDGFSEAEQLAAYRERYGVAADREAKRQTLVNRQLKAIAWLEIRYAQRVKASDPCGAWLSDSLAYRLEVANIVTISDLIDRINGLGLGWYRAISGIGAGKAKAITGFLRAHADTIGKPILALSDVPKRRQYAHERERVVAPATALVPLEKFVVPVKFDGHDGKFRLPRRQCKIPSVTDKEAIVLWLGTRNAISPEQLQRRHAFRNDLSTATDPMQWAQYPSNTQRAYRKELERFLLWAILVRQKALSSMALDDCLAYLAFVASPPASWCGPGQRERWTPLWRPFQGPLTQHSQRTTISVLCAFYTWLNDSGYMAGNPWKDLLHRTPRSSEPPASRMTEAEWTHIAECLAALPDTIVNRRLQLLLPLLYETGIPLSRALALRVGDIRRVQRAPGNAPQWVLAVHGKHGVPRFAEISEKIAGTLQTALQARGLPDDPALCRDELLFVGAAPCDFAPWAKVVHRTDNQPLSPITLNRQIKQFLCRCANRLDSESLETNRLNRMPSRGIRKCEDPPTGLELYWRIGGSGSGVDHDPA